MIFNEHFNLVGKHAVLSPSKYHWLNYDEDKLDRFFVAQLAAQRGTEYHALAAELIRMGEKLPRKQRTLNLYVNDGIGFHMTPEPVLFYSDNCYGSPDTIAFRRNKLRIHDLKMGVNEASVRQLEAYAGLFCLEYHVDPFTIEMELRIYQNNEVRIYDADPIEIAHVMEQIKFASKRYDQLRAEALS